MGQSVEVYSRSSGAWASGTVTALESDGYRVTYGDGSGNQHEKVVATPDAAQLLRRPPPAAAQVADAVAFQEEIEL